MKPNCTIPVLKSNVQLSKPDSEINESLVAEYRLVEGYIRPAIRVCNSGRRLTLSKSLLGSIEAWPD